MDALVSTEWLAGEQGASDLRIVDATYFLPEHGRQAQAEYEAAHIPGAVFMDLGDIADTSSDLPMMLPSPEKFASRMGKLGLGDGVRIVLYDGSPHHTAARGWAMLRAFGIPDVAILDGGVAAWRAGGHPIETGSAAAKPRHATPRDEKAGVASIEDVRNAIRTGREQIVDARSPARFAGEEPEPRAGVTPGHVPGSANLHYARLFDADGRWKRGDALAAAFVAAGVDIDRPVIATCGSGVTAATIALALHLLGREAKVYDGSWAEWGRAKDTPKATGRV